MQLKKLGLTIVGAAVLAAPILATPALAQNEQFIPMLVYRTGPYAKPFGSLIIFFLIVEPNGFARLWQIAKEKLRLWPFPY